MKRIKRIRRVHDRDDDSPPPQGWGTVILWGAMFLLVVMVIFNIVPISQGISPMRSRKEKKIIQSAEALMDDENWSAAAQVYSEILEDSRASTTARVQSALELHDLYKDRLSSPGLALDAIRDAYLLERDPVRHADLKQKWKSYSASVGTIDRPFAVPEGATVIAEIGGDQITLDEILLAWQRQGSDSPLTPETMAKYIQDYMTNALLAEGARIRGEGKKPAFLLDMRNLERGALSREIQISMHKPADRSEVEAFYEKHRDRYHAPDSIALQHIVVRGESDATSVTQQLASGTDFVEIARAVSLDRDSLVNGCELGRMGTTDDFVPNVGILPGFAMRMAAKEEGYTTGPLQTARGHHWFRLQTKSVGQPHPLDEIYARVEKDCRKAAFDTARLELINELKRTIPTKMYEDRIKAASEKLARLQQAASTPSGGSSDDAGPPKP